MLHTIVCVALLERSGCKAFILPACLSLLSQALYNILALCFGGASALTWVFPPPQPAVLLQLFTSLPSKHEHQPLDPTVCSNKDLPVLLYAALPLFTLLPPLLAEQLVAAVRAQLDAQAECNLYTCTQHILSDNYEHS